MSTTTRLAPLTPERARQVLAYMQEARNGADTALALDREGNLLGTVPADDTEVENAIGDHDVHS